MRKIHGFLERFWNALCGRGFQTVDDIVQRFYAGEIGARDNPEAFERLRLARLAAQHGLSQPQINHLRHVARSDFAKVSGAFQAAKVSAAVRGATAELLGTQRD